MRLGRYEILEELGRGAMGVVYKAHDPLLNRIVAIKTMSEEAAENSELRSRLEREAVLAGKLRHPNIITIHDIGEEGGIPFVAMEFLEGIDLRHITSHQIQLYPSEKWGILKQICLGLHHAHKEGVVHRDIKPGNIRILSDGTVKIMDFGIARVASSQLTQVGMVLGSVNYMSPEQVEGHKVDHRSDIFSLGILGYELLSYRLPFKSDSMSATMFSIMKGQPAPLDPAAVNFPPAIKDVISKCLEKHPGDRYQDAIDIVQELDALKPEIRDVVGTTLADADRRRGSAGASVDPDATVIGTPEASETSSTVRLWVSSDRFQRISESIKETLPEKPARPKLPTRSTRAPAAATAPTQVVAAPVPSRRPRGLAAAGLVLIIAASAVGYWWVRKSAADRSIANHMGEAAERLDARDYVGAIGEFEKVLVIAPDHEAARSGIERAQRAERDMAGLIERGREMVQEGSFEAAVATLERAVEGDPQNQELADLLVEARAGLERTSGAAQAYERGAEALARGNLGLAVTELERALELDPDRPEIGERLREARAELARPRFGTLTVQAIPYGEVFLDGESLGVTPVNLNRVPVGNHTLRVVRDGYQEFAQTVLVEEGKSKNVVAELVKKP